MTESYLFTGKIFILQQIHTERNRDDVVDVDTLEREIRCEREIRAPIVCFITFYHQKRHGLRKWVRVCISASFTPSIPVAIIPWQCLVCIYIGEFAFLEFPSVSREKTLRLPLRRLELYYW